MNDLAYSYAKAGRKEDVRRVLADLLEMRKVSKRAASAIAGVYTVLGDHEEAFEWLEMGFEEHSPYMPPFNTTSSSSPSEATHDGRTCCEESAWAPTSLATAPDPQGSTSRVA